MMRLRLTKENPGAGYSQKPTSPIHARSGHSRHFAIREIAKGRWNLILLKIINRFMRHDEKHYIMIPIYS